MNELNTIDVTKLENVDKINDICKKLEYHMITYIYQYDTQGLINDKFIILYKYISKLCVITNLYIMLRNEIKNKIK